MISKFFLTVFILLCFSQMFFGCGGATGPDRENQKKSEIVKKADPIDRPAEFMGLRILSDHPSGNDPTLPDVNASLNSPLPSDEYTADASKIVIHTKLFLADPQSGNPSKRREWFFVWPDQSLGVPISSAVYSHRVHTPDGTRIGNLRSNLVWHDVQNCRWFIPLSDIFANRIDYGPMVVSSEDTQEVTVELILESGRKVTITIQFQVSGPLPLTQLNSHPVTYSAAPDHFIRDVSRGGVVVYSESVHNPTSRPFHLWVRSRVTSGYLTLVSHLTTPRQFTNIMLRGVTLIEYYQSKGDIELSELEINYATGTQETRTLKAQRWEKVILDAKGTVTFNWRAIPALRTPNCALPPSTAQVFQQLNVSPLKEICAPRVMQWALVGGVLSGDWEREVRLTHTYTTTDDATLDPSSPSHPVEYMTLDKSHIVTNQSVGNTVGGRLAFPCQGVFP